MSSCNRLVAERIERNQHERHIRALECSRGMVDRRTPQDHPHLRSKPKTKQLQEDRAAEIQLENRILLQKMLSIDTKPSQLSNDTLTNSRPNAKSLNGEAQRRELDRITNSNQELMKRLQGAKPSIDLKTWEDEEVDRQARIFRLSQNSRRGRMPRLRMPERPGPDELPRISGHKGIGRGEDNWADMSNAELDKKLRELENARGGGHLPLDVA